MKTIVCSADKVKNIVELKQQGKIPSLTHVIYFEDFKPVEIDEIEANTSGLTLIRYKDALEEGSKMSGIQWDPVTPDTLYTFCYTSGTTGLPKGVMLSHQNYVSTAAAGNRFDRDFEVNENDVFYSYLPLAHVMERGMLISALLNCCQYGFYQGYILKIREDMAVLRPTVLASVPRLFNRFYDGMKQKINELEGFQRRLADAAIEKKLRNLQESGKTDHGFYDCIIFKKFRALLGGRVRLMLTGSAPIAKEVLSFLKVAFCCPIIEGYGQTENTGPATMTWSTDPNTGHVGSPIPCLDVKLVDVPEMKYTSEDKDEHGVLMPRGEVCYRGYNCFKGYFRQPQMTRETIDSDGWVHSGDIGQFLPAGVLKIIDRKKNIFKL